MSMLKKITDLAKSEKGRELADKATAKAKQIANDPEKREKIDAVKRRFNERVGGGADKPATDAGTTAGEGATGAPTAPGTTGVPGASGPTGGSAGTGPSPGGGDKAA